jgi:hypothetical protein
MGVTFDKKTVPYTHTSVTLLSVTPRVHARPVYVEATWQKRDRSAGKEKNKNKEMLALPVASLH